LTLFRGFTYYFNVNAPNHPLWIKTSQLTGTDAAYNTGVTNNGTSTGILSFTVPSSAPDTLYYICEFHASMSGTLNIQNFGVNQTSSIGLSTRSVVTGTTSVIANLSTTSINLEGFKTYVLSKIETSTSSWVRIYVDSTSRSADSTRSEDVDPLPGSGILAEVITGQNNLTQLITPGIIGFNNDSPTTGTIYLSVTNKSGTSQSINVTLTLLQLEL
jgi:hypothetical protein